MTPAFFCRECGARYPLETMAFKCACGGAFLLDFSPPPFTLEGIDRGVWGLARYHKTLPLSKDELLSVSLGEGMTPVLDLGDGLFVKMDYMMPTLSFKDRGAVMVMALCKRLGVRRVVQDSSGNAGNSIAAYAARAGIACEIFVPEGTSKGKVKMIEALGAQASLIPGTRAGTAKACLQRAEQTGAYYASHVYNPLFYEGTKTYIYEVFEQLGRIPRSLFVPTGNGTLLIGVIKGLLELKESGCIDALPQIYAVQSEMCDPLFRAHVQGSAEPAPVEARPTLAEGISIASPFRGAYLLSLLKQTGAKVIHAPEGGIEQAQLELAQKGLFVEHTTAATYAAFQHVRDALPEPGDCLIPLCGAGLKSVKG